MKWQQALGGALLVLGVVALNVTSAGAVHEGNNALIFAPVDDGSLPAANGNGTIDFRGGDAAESRWTATFQFVGLNAATAYTVVVQGRFGEDGSPEATAFTEICNFMTDISGVGGCWYYVVVLKRLATVELREGGVDGTAVLRATRGDGPGSIAGVPNRFSPPTVAATPSATPIATPATTR